MSEQFPYVVVDPSLGDVSALPLLPITLTHQQHRISTDALVDSGATLNVLPLDVGLQLGLDWDQQSIALRLTGALNTQEARAVLVEATIGSLPSVRLAFAWIRSNDVRVLLGQTNFFQEFDVCFYRSRLMFEIAPTP